MSSTPPRSRSPEVTWKYEVSQGGHGLDPRDLFTDWQGMKDTAAILGRGNPVLMRGSELDVGMLNKSADALKWMNTGIWSGDAKSFADRMTTDIQAMLTS